MMTTLSQTLPADISSLNRHAVLGLASVVLLVGGLGLWAANTNISGAVVSGGTLVVESYAKQIQHQDGGTVREIRVHNDDAVTAGDVLLTLDDTALRASLSVVTAQLSEALVQEARLMAQLAGKAQFAVPAELDAGDRAIDALRLTQQQLLDAAIADRDGRVGQLNEQISQLDHQIEGLALQQEAAEKQLAILTARGADLDALYAKQLAQAAEVSNLHMQQAAAEGETGRLISAIAQTRATIAEKKLAIAQTLTGATQQALDQLQRTRQTIAETRQQKLAGEDRLARTIIRAPQTGIVHESIVHTVGGVVTPGQTLMQIVPASDNLLVNIRIDSADIDSVHLDQTVNLRFVTLDKRRTPEAEGRIASISPDLVIEPQTGRRYYTADVRIDADEKARIGAQAKLLPGMPVEAFVTTGDRSVLNYLLHPLLEEMQLAFREQ